MEKLEQFKSELHELQKKYSVNMYAGYEHFYESDHGIWLHDSKSGDTEFIPFEDTNYF